MPNISCRVPASFQACLFGSKDACSILSFQLTAGLTLTRCDSLFNVQWAVAAKYVKGKVTLAKTFANAVGSLSPSEVKRPLIARLPQRDASLEHVSTTTYICSARAKRNPTRKCLSAHLTGGWMTCERRMAAKREPRRSDGKRRPRLQRKEDRRCTFTQVRLPQKQYPVHRTPCVIELDLLHTASPQGTFYKTKTTRAGRSFLESWVQKATFH